MNNLRLQISDWCLIVVVLVGVCVAGAVVWVRSNAKGGADQPPRTTTARASWTPTPSRSARPGPEIEDRRPAGQQCPLDRPLPHLSGSLALDTDKLARVHSRFPGEIMEIAPSLRRQGQPDPGAALLRAGDKVKAGQLLAVVWYKDLGEKRANWSPPSPCSN